MQYFGEPEGRVKIQMMSKNLQRYYTLKCLIRDLSSNVFVSPKFWLAKVFNLSPGRGMRWVQISCDICTRFARYLYSTKQCWIINREILTNLLCVLFETPFFFTGFARRDQASVPQLCVLILQDGDRERWNNRVQNKAPCTGRRWKGKEWSYFLSVSSV